MRARWKEVAFYCSTHGGKNWTLADNSLTNAYVTAFAINGPGRIFAAILVVEHSFD